MSLLQPLCLRMRVRGYSRLKSFLLPLHHTLLPVTAARQAIAIRSLITDAGKTPPHSSEITTPEPPLASLDVKLDEETLPYYEAEAYYPVILGQIFHERYQVLVKLGYGISSTVWLARDLLTKKHVTLKVFACKHYSVRETRMLTVLDAVPSSDHAGQQYLRRPLDAFETKGPDGDHECLVYEPLGWTVLELRRSMAFNRLTRVRLGWILCDLVQALHYLHTEAHLIHTDVQSNNVLLKFDDDKAVNALEQEENNDPSLRKVLPNRTIYRSRRSPRSSGRVRLCDFGEARFGAAPQAGMIMPHSYRAPEVVLGMSWSYPVDVWSLGILIWELFEPRSRLFDWRDENGNYSIPNHMAQMVAFLGPPPLEFLRRSPHTAKLWQDDGTWKNIVPIPDLSFEKCEERLQGGEKVGFLNMLRKMLAWLPEERFPLDKIWKDPWLGWSTGEEALEWDVDEYKEMEAKTVAEAKAYLANTGGDADQAAIPSDDAGSHPLDTLLAELKTSRPADE